jgi:hypothetical protein
MVRNEDEAWTSRGSGDRQEGKTATKEGVCRIGYLDLGQLFLLWVLYGGIKLCTRLTGLSTPSC